MAVLASEFSAAGGVYLRSPVGSGREWVCGEIVRKWRRRVGVISVVFFLYGNLIRSSSFSHIITRRTRTSDFEPTARSSNTTKPPRTTYKEPTLPCQTLSGCALHLRCIMLRLTT